MSREVELGWASWTSFASSCPSCSSTAVQRTLSLWLCPSMAVETAVVQCTSCWAMARGHRLNTSVVLAAVHGLSGLFRAVSAVEPSFFRPLPPLSLSLISHLASVDIKQNVYLFSFSVCGRDWPDFFFFFFFFLKVDLLANFYFNIFFHAIRSCPCQRHVLVLQGSVLGVGQFCCKQ